MLSCGGLSPEVAVAVYSYHVSSFHSPRLVSAGFESAKVLWSHQPHSAILCVILIYGCPSAVGVQGRCMHRLLIAGTGLPELLRPQGFQDFSTFTDSKSQPWKASEHQASTVPAFITSYLFSGVQSQEIWVGGHMFCPWTKYPCVVYRHMDSEGEKRHLCTSCQGCPKCFVCMWDFVGSIPYALPVPYTK